MDSRRVERNKGHDSEADQEQHEPTVWRCQSVCSLYGYSPREGVLGQSQKGSQFSQEQRGGENQIKRTAESWLPCVPCSPSSPLSSFASSTSKIPRISSSSDIHILFSTRPQSRWRRSGYAPAWHENAWQLNPPICAPLPSLLAIKMQASQTRIDWKTLQRVTLLYQTVDRQSPPRTRQLT